MATGRWTLPGPVRLIAEICDELYRERVATVRSPQDVTELARAIECRLHDDGQVRVLLVNVGPDDRALEVIASEIGVTGAGPAALVTAPELAGCAIVLVAQCTTIEPSLESFARLASRTRTGSEPLLIVVGDGQLPSLGGKQPREARGIVGPLDAAAQLAHLTFTTSPFERLLVASVAMETACWDVEILDRLASLPFAAAVRPDLCLESWKDARLSSWSGAASSWAAGSLDDWNGETCEHPLWLAVNRPEGLSKRVWRGQASALLPWIETRRLEAVAAYRAILTPDLDRCGPDIESLDWGPLSRQLTKQPPWLREFAEQFRSARNELAHGRPLAWAHISGLSAVARRWNAGRGAPPTIR